MLQGTRSLVDGMFNLDNSGARACEVEWLQQEGKERKCGGSEVSHGYGA